MRVISGKYRGKRLQSPVGNDIRPTSDVVKESIFNVLQFEINGATFVDLFSGTGNIGIEAISRGAERVIFVDNGKDSLALIAENLKFVKEEYTILSKDYRDALQSISGKIDYIFVDAPYAKNCINEVCDIVARRDMLGDNGYIIYEHDKNLDYTISNSWYVKKSRKFGTIVVDYIAKVQKLCAFSGSFDPITIGHINIVDQALKDFDKVQIIIGINEQKERLFDLKTRLEIAQACLKNKLNVNILVYNGLIYEFCKDNNIQTVVRGIRNEEDLKYEKELADFNLAKGGIVTKFYNAEKGFETISSTDVKNALKADTSLNNLIPLGMHSTVKRLYLQSQGIEVVTKKPKQVDSFFEEEISNSKNHAKKSKQGDFKDGNLDNDNTNGSKKQRKPLSSEEQLKRQEKKLKKYGKVNEFEQLVEQYNNGKNKK